MYSIVINVETVTVALTVIKYRSVETHAKTILINVDWRIFKKA